MIYVLIKVVGAYDCSVVKIVAVSKNKSNLEEERKHLIELNDLHRNIDQEVYQLFCALTEQAPKILKAADQDCLEWQNQCLKQHNQLAQTASKSVLAKYQLPKDAEVLFDRSLTLEILEVPEI